MKAETALVAQDSSELYNLADKSQMWQDYFAHVSIISTELEESVTSAVLEAVSVAFHESGSNDSLVKVPSKG